MKTFSTYLPIFPGFYNTIFDESDSFVERKTNSEREFRENYDVPADMPWDFIRSNFWDCISYAPGNLAVAQACADSLPVILPEFVKSVEFEEMRSPREYNFGNDAVDLKITVDVKAVRKFLKEHRAEFSAWLVARYTSRDGFISSYSNDISDWYIETKNLSAMDGHYCGAVLDFIASVELEDPQMAMYYAADGSEAFWNAVKIDLPRLVESWDRKAALARP